MKNINTYKQFINEEIYIRHKDAIKKTGSHNILYLTGSRQELKQDLRLNILRKKQYTYNLLSKFGDNIEYQPLYWRGGDILFDEINDTIIDKNVDVLVGNSAGGFLSFYCSNGYKIPALSINPAMAPNSEAPTLQTLPDDLRNAPIFGKQVIVIGENDSKAKGGVDGFLVIDMLKDMQFEQKGGEIIILPGVEHNLTTQQFDDVFSYFYKKFVKNE